MGGFFGVASKNDCVFDLFFGVDYHSHLGTRRGGMCVWDAEKGFNRAIHNIENSPFRTKFDHEFQDMHGTLGIGCISDFEPQPLTVRSHHGTYALTTVSKINNVEELTKSVFDAGHSHFLEMSGGEINSTELVAGLIKKTSSTESIMPSKQLKVLFHFYCLRPWESIVPATKWDVPLLLLGRKRMPTAFLLKILHTRI